MATTGAESATKKQKKGILDSLIDAAFSVGNAVAAPFAKSEKVKLPEVIKPKQLKLPLPKIVPSFGTPYLVAAAEVYDDLQWQHAIAQYSPEALMAALSEKLFHVNDTLLTVATRSRIPGVFTKILKLHSKEKQIELLKHHHFEDINALFSAMNRPSFDEVLSHYISAEKEALFEIPTPTILNIIRLQHKSNNFKGIQQILRLNATKTLIFEVIKGLKPKIELLRYLFNFETELETIAILHTFIKNSPSLDAINLETNKTIFENIQDLLKQVQNLSQERPYPSISPVDPEKTRPISLKLEKLQYALVAHGAYVNELPANSVFRSHVINHHSLAGLITGKIGLPLTIVCKVGEFLVKPDLLVHFRSGAKVAYLAKRENSLTYQEEDTSMNLYAKKPKKEDEVEQVNPKNRKRKRD